MQKDLLGLPFLVASSPAAPSVYSTNCCGSQLPIEAGAEKICKAQPPEGQDGGLLVGVMGLGGEGGHRLAINIRAAVIGRPVRPQHLWWL